MGEHQISGATRALYSHPGISLIVTFTFSFDGTDVAQTSKSTAVKNIVVVHGAFADGFDHPRVADAVSDLFRGVFGIEGMPVRVVLGVVSLPLAAPIELDVTFEVTQ